MKLGGMTFEVIVLAIAASHVVTIALILLWFGLRRPTSLSEFWRRFKREFLTLRPPV